MKQFTLLLLQLPFCFAATRIVGVTASTTLVPDIGSISQIINLSGLTAPVGLTSTHSTSASSIFRAIVRRGSILFTFPSVSCMSGFSFWSAAAGFEDFGIRDVQLFSSLDGVAFSPIIGAPNVFSRRPEPSPISPEVFSFPPVSAAFVNLTFTSIYQPSGGSTQIGEIMFAEENALACIQGVE